MSFFSQNTPYAGFIFDAVGEICTPMLWEKTPAKSPLFCGFLESRVV
jgi:hypothetical protein